MTQELVKILHLRSSGGMLGAESVIREIALYSPQFGFESIVGLIHDQGDPEPEFAQVLRDAGLPVIIFNCNGRLDWQLAERIRNYIKESNVKIVHSHGYKTDFYTILLGSDVIKVGTNHLWKNTNTALKLYSWIDRLCLRQFDQIVAVSQPILLEMQGLLLKNVPMQLIPNGVNIEKFNSATETEIAALRSKYSIPQDEEVIMTVSSLTGEKGHRYLLSALGDKLIRNAPWKLIIVGEGLEELFLRKQTAELGIAGKVIFAGKQSNIPLYLMLADIFVLPSLIEGLPMALLEAMGSARAVIASNVGDVAQAVEDGATGLLVEPQNSTELTSALTSLLGHAEKRKQLGAKAYERIKLDYSSLRMTEEYCRLYRKLLKC